MGELIQLPTENEKEWKLTAPFPLNQDHARGDFDCGKVELNDWLKERAGKAEARSARTYVVCDGKTVIGYYCLAAGTVIREELPKKLQRNMPHHVPVIILGRLAVDKEYAGRGVGKGLLKDALLRSLKASSEIGAAAVLVHAIDDDAITFYTPFGFNAFPLGSRSLFMPTTEIVQALG